MNEEDKEKLEKKKEKKEEEGSDQPLLLRKKNCMRTVRITALYADLFQMGNTWRPGASDESL